MFRAMDALNPHELAWAAGFFDAEGYVGASRRTGRKTFRLQMSVSQAHLAPLQRFAKALGDQGNFFGPARGYLYYWYSHRFRTVCEAMSLLWPWLSAPKRTQFTLALARAHRDAPCEAPSRAPEPDTGHERAWAAGLFDGEGYIAASRHPNRGREIRASIAQAGRESTPLVLPRFRDAVGVGVIRGPRVLSSPWSRLPQWRWEVTSVRDVESVRIALWPWLGERSRDRFGTALGVYGLGLRSR